METITFGQTLRKLRENAGLRLKDLADKMGYKIEDLSDIERNKRPIPSEGEIKEIASILNIDVQILFDAANSQDDKIRNVFVKIFNKLSPEDIDFLIRNLESFKRNNNVKIHNIEVN